MWLPLTCQLAWTKQPWLVPTYWLIQPCLIGCQIHKTLVRFPLPINHQLLGKWLQKKKNNPSSFAWQNMAAVFENYGRTWQNYFTHKRESQCYIPMVFVILSIPLTERGVKGTWHYEEKGICSAQCTTSQDVDKIIVIQDGTGRHQCWRGSHENTE